MKILFVDTAMDGHHIEYLNALTESTQYRSAIAVPSAAGGG